MAGAVTAITDHIRTCIECARKDVRGPWLRAAPFLLRQRLELIVGERLSGRGISSSASMRAKLICLRSLDGNDVGAEASWLWNRLSRACHYGGAGTEPTLDDLTDWAERLAALAPEAVHPAG